MSNGLSDLFYFVLIIGLYIYFCMKIFISVDVINSNFLSRLSFENFRFSIGLYNKLPDHMTNLVISIPISSILTCAQAMYC